MLERTEHRPAAEGERSLGIINRSDPLNYFESGSDIRTFQELLGPYDVKTTMIYPYVLHQGPGSVRSPLDGM